ncbi:MAG: arsenate reductase (glutaredoxin) [Bacteroidota bacterium]
MLTIFHNPRCKKSREGLQILEESGKDFSIVKYLDEVPSATELKAIIKKLAISPIDLVRTKEKIWKENFKGKDLSDDEVVEAMIAYPKLIERPIVFDKGKAVVGRPPENIKEIL